MAVTTACSPANGAAPASAPADSKPISSFKGRPRADVWELFTETPNPHRLVSCVCRHCGVEVAHRKKSERAKAHLAKRCPPFRALMLAIEDEALRPDWFNYLHTTTRRVKSEGSATKAPAAKRARVSPPPSIAPATATASTPTKVEPSSVNSNAHAVATETVATKAAVLSAVAPLLPIVASTGRTEAHDTSQPPQGKAVLHTQQALETALVEQLALHFYVTGAPFANIEDAFLLRAFRAVLPTAVLPGRAQLTGELLDACYANVKAAVDRAAAAAKSAHALASAATPGASAIVQSCALLIQSIFASPLTRTTPTTDASPLEPLAAFVQDCRTVVALFVDDAQLRTKLEREQQALNCAPLTPFPATAWTELPAWLDAIKGSEEIIYELVTSHDFLVRDKAALGSSSSAHNTTLQERERVSSIVTSERFFDDLDKCLQLLEPVRATAALAHASADAATAAASPVSSAYYSACVSVRDTWDKLFCLSPAERTQLLELARSTRCAAASCSDAGVAYLLDPRYLGDGMASDERDGAEDYLFDFFHRTGSSTSTSAEALEQQKEALFQEYTAFVIKRSSARTGFRFQMLVKGTKTIQQFWLTDGHQFPLLQQVALAVFTPEPPRAVNGAAATRAPGRRTTGDAAPVQLHVTPMKAGSGASRVSISPGSSVTPSPSARRTTTNAEGLDHAQLEKLAFIKAHAALLLQEELSPAAADAHSGDQRGARSSSASGK